MPSCGKALIECVQELSVHLQITGDVFEGKDWHHKVRSHT